jgi:mannose-1-phosphate guanylyltransferase
MSTVEPAVFRRQEAHIYPVILCGASVVGERRGSDEQLSHFVRAGRGRTAFQEVLLWNSADAGLAAPVVVVDQRHRFLVAEQQADLRIAASNVILEPSACSRGTAANLAMAALWLRSRDPKGLMLVQPVDHARYTPGQFHEALALSLFSAYSGNIISFVVDDRRRGGSGLFLIGVTRYLDVLRLTRPNLLDVCERSFDAAPDGLGHARLTQAMPPEPSLSVEKTLEGVVDIALRVPAGGERDRHALHR